MLRTPPAESLRRPRHGDAPRGSPLNPLACTALATSSLPSAPVATALLARMFPGAYRWFITKPSWTPLLLTRREHLVGLVDSEGQRLFAQDVLARLGSRECGLVMQVIGEADRNSPDRIVGEQLPVVGCRRCSEAFTEFARPCFVLIRDTDQTDAIVGETPNAPGVRRRDPPTTDDAVPVPVCRLRRHFDHSPCRTSFRSQADTPRSRAYENRRPEETRS